jgi:hypothetical protein
VANQPRQPAPPPGGDPPRPAGSPGYFRGVASVPPRPGRRPLGDTVDLPPVEAFPATAPDPPPARRPLPPPRGMIARRRWRRLRSGAGWSWTGASFLLVCWGVWVVSVRGSDLVGPVIGLVLVFAVGALMFAVARLLGRAVLEQALGRERPSAWPSHLTAGAFLMAAGIAFLQQTQWIVDSLQWAGGLWQRMLDGWSWLVDQWPF